jgi:hypothetical protein
VATFLALLFAKREIGGKLDGSLERPAQVSA